MVENISPVDVLKELKKTPLRMVAWEVTRACNLDCVHCRAAAVNEPLPTELSTQEAYDFLSDVASFARPVIILTGGEPLLRADIFDLAAFGKKLGLQMVMAPNGTLIDDAVTREMKKVGINRVSISIDGSKAEIHDAFRRVAGAFEGALRGIDFLKRAGISFQVNTTVTKHNLDDLQNLLELVKKTGAVAWHVFLLVPTGRAKDMKEEEISPASYEKTLNWLYQVQRSEEVFVKPTCAPHYYRIFVQRSKREGKPLELPHQRYEMMTRGCLGGISFCFVSHEGEVYPCGYFEVLAGRVREEGFRKVWESSRLFLELRDFSKLKGRCGRCEYVDFCGGCRARAYSNYGDYLAEEPYCVYQPKGKVSK